MKRRVQIEGMIARTKRELEQIDKDYSEAIENKTTTFEFDVLVNDYFHHTRQALDFIAHEIYERYCKLPKRDVYFPFATPTNAKTRGAFETKLDQWFPNLRSSKPKVFEYLGDIQQFPPDGWLAEFHLISNTNKHDNL